MNVFYHGDIEILYDKGDFENFYNSQQTKYH